jgi:type IV secretory pathway TrbD component
VNLLRKIDEQNRASIERNAERILADTYFDGLRSPRVLRVVVAAYAIVTILMTVAWIQADWAGAIGVVLWFVAFLVLRLAVRSQADLPDAALDERMKSERDEAYLHAYRLVSGLSVIAVMGAFFVVVGGDGGKVVSFGYNAISAIFWSLLALVMGAPSISLAMLQSKRTT